MLGEGWVGKAWDWLQTAKKEELETLNKINSVVMARDPRDLAKIYVEPDLQRTNPADMLKDEITKEDELFRIPSYKWLDTFLGEPKQKDGRHVAFILSDAGMGKTSLLAMLRLTALQGQWPGMDFELFRLGPMTLKDIKSIESPMDTVLLLDSLDEDTEVRGMIEGRIEEILKATQQFRQVIITCRTQFFPLENRFQRGGSWIKIGGFSCQTVYLSLFSDRQIQVCLEKQFPRNEAKIEQATNLLGKMKSLSMRPMLLGYVDDLLEREILGGAKEWTRFTTYRAMVQAWLDREERKPESRVKADELLAACHLMAIAIQSKGGGREIAPWTLEELLGTEGVPDSIRLIDIGGRSLLNLNSEGSYRFAHYSIQEFLIVDHMARYPEQMEGYAAKIWYTDELLRFLVDWSQQAEGWTANLSGAHLIDAQLSDAQLTGANLSRAKLGNANLSSANLSSANLSSANLRGADLSGTDLRGARLGKADLRKADLRKANLGDAQLTGAILNAAKLVGADFTGADLNGAYLRNAYLRNADLTGADLTGADLSDADLSGIRNLTQAQLDSAKGDAKTVLPLNLAHPKHWET